MARLFLAGMVFSVQSLFVHAAETNIWQERRRLMAAAPSSADPLRILNALPAPASQMVSVSSKVRERLSPLKSGPFPALLAALPAQAGDVRKVLLPARGAPTGTVVIVQDVHANEEAQRNIGQLVRRLAGKDGAGVVGLEGAFAPMDFGAFNAYPDREVLRDVADHGLSQGWVSGPVHSAILGETSAPLIGVDDPVHHPANVEAYRASQGSAGDRRQALDARRSALSAEKERLFHPALKALDGQIEAYRAGTGSLGDYVQALAAGAPDLPPDVRRFREALEMEKSLDFDKVQAERSDLLKAVAGALSRPRLEELARAAADYRLGNVGHGDFYRFLRAFCAEAGVPLSRYPAVDAYVRYALASDAIDASGLLSALPRLEAARCIALARTPEEKRLVAESRRLFLAAKLTDFALIPEEWAEYQASKDRAEEWVPFEAFYREAQARDVSMSRNLLQAMKDRGTDSSVLVAGGFHTEGVAKLLADAGAAVVVVSPRLTRVDAAEGSAYLSVFTQEKTPLDKLFAGEKLFLSRLQMTPADKGLFGASLAAKKEADTPGNRPDEEDARDAQPFMPEGVEAGPAKDAPGGAVVEMRRKDGGKGELFLPVQGGRISGPGRESARSGAWARAKRWGPRFAAGMAAFWTLGTGMAPSTPEAGAFILKSGVGYQESAPFAYGEYAPGRMEADPVFAALSRGLQDFTKARHPLFLKIHKDFSSVTEADKAEYAEMKKKLARAAAPHASTLLRFLPSGRWSAVPEEKWNQLFYQAIPAFLAAQGVFVETPPGLQWVNRPGWAQEMAEPINLYKVTKLRPPDVTGVGFPTFDAEPISTEMKGTETARAVHGAVVFFAANLDRHVENIRKLKSVRNVSPRSEEEWEEVRGVDPLSFSDSKIADRFLRDPRIGDVGAFFRDTIGRHEAQHLRNQEIPGWAETFHRLSAEGRIAEADTYEELSATIHEFRHPEAAGRNFAFFKTLVGLRNETFSRSRRLIGFNLMDRMIKAAVADALQDPAGSPIKLDSKSRYSDAFQAAGQLYRLADHPAVLNRLLDVISKDIENEVRTGVSALLMPEKIDLRALYGDIERPGFSGSPERSVPPADTLRTEDSGTGSWRWIAAVSAIALGITGWFYARRQRLERSEAERAAAVKAKKGPATRAKGKKGRSLTLGLTYWLGDKILRSRIAHRLGFGVEKPTPLNIEMRVAWWLEIPFTLLLPFVWWHDNRDEETGRTDWRGKFLPRLGGWLAILAATALGFWMPGLESLGGRIVLAMAGNAFVHLLYNFLFPGAPLTLKKGGGPEEKLRKGLEDAMKEARDDLEGLSAGDYGQLFQTRLASASVAVWAGATPDTMDERMRNYTRLVGVVVQAAHKEALRLHPSAKGKIMLAAYGSYARGEMIPSSDIDLCVVAEKTDKDVVEVFKFLRQALGPLRGDVMLMGLEELEAEMGRIVSEKKEDAPRSFQPEEVWERHPQKRHSPSAGWIDREEEYREYQGRAQLVSRLLDMKPVTKNEGLWSRVREINAKTEDDWGSTGRLLTLMTAWNMHFAWSGHMAGLHSNRPDLKEGLGGVRDLQSIDWFESLSGQKLLSREEREEAARIFRELQFLRLRMASVARTSQLVPDTLETLSSETPSRQDEWRSRFRPHEQQPDYVKEAFPALGMMQDVYALLESSFDLHRRVGERALSAAFPSTLAPPASKPLEVTAGPFEFAPERTATFDPLRGFVLRAGSWVRLQPGMKEAFRTDPALAMDAFLASARMGVPLSPETLNDLRKASPDFARAAEAANRLWDEEGRANPFLERTRTAFLRLMDSPAQISPLLWQMKELGYLSALVPELGRLHNLVQMEELHLYAADAHLIKAEEQLETLGAWAVHHDRQGLGRLFDWVSAEPGRWRKIRLTVLFHDLGKPAWMNPPHTEVDWIGAHEIVPAALARLGVPESEALEIRWTIFNDTLLFNAARRGPLVYQDHDGDYHLDPQFRMAFERARFGGDIAIQDFTASVQAEVPELMKNVVYELPLLDFADSAGTNPRNLPAVLDRIESYGHVLSRLTEDGIDLAGVAAEAEHSKREEVLQVLARSGEEDRLASVMDFYFKITPFTFWEDRKADVVARDIELLAAMEDGGEPFRVLVRDPKTLLRPYEVIVMIRDDQPGLLARVTAVLTAQGLGIISSQGSSGRMNRVVDRFLVQPQDANRPIREIEKSLRDGLSSLLVEGRPIRDLFSGGYEFSNPRAQKPMISFSRGPGSTLRVQVRAADFRGFLHVVSRVLGDGFHLNVHSAAVDTEGPFAIDTFLVTTAEGAVPPAALHGPLRKTLEDVLSRKSIDLDAVMDELPPPPSRPSSALHAGDLAEQVSLLVRRAAGMGLLEGVLRQLEDVLSPGDRTLVENLARGASDALLKQARVAPFLGIVQKILFQSGVMGGTEVAGSPDFADLRRRAADLFASPAVAARLAKAGIGSVIVRTHDSPELVEGPGRFLLAPFYQDAEGRWVFSLDERLAEWIETQGAEAPELLARLVEREALLQEEALRRLRALGQAPSDEQIDRIYEGVHVWVLSQKGQGAFFSRIETQAIPWMLQLGKRWPGDAADRAAGWPRFKKALIEARPRLLAFSRKRFGPQGEDFVQTTLEKAWRERGSFDPEKTGGRLTRWLFQIMIRAGLDVIRSESMAREKISELARIQQDRRDPGPEVRVMAGEAGRRVTADLGQTERDIFALDAAGFSDQEISEKIGTRPSRIRQIRHRLRAALAKRWTDLKQEAAPDSKPGGISRDLHRLWNALPLDKVSWATWQREAHVRETILVVAPFFLTALAMLFGVVNFDDATLKKIWSFAWGVFLIAHLRGPKMNMLFAGVLYVFNVVVDFAPELAVPAAFISHKVVNAVAPALVRLFKKPPFFWIASLDKGEQLESLWRHAGTEWFQRHGKRARLLFSLVSNNTGTDLVRNEPDATMRLVEWMTEQARKRSSRQSSEIPIPLRETEDALPAASHVSEDLADASMVTDAPAVPEGMPLDLTDEVLRRVDRLVGNQSSYLLQVADKPLSEIPRSFLFPVSWLTGHSWWREGGWKRRGAALLGAGVMYGSAVWLSRGIVGLLLNEPFGFVPFMGIITALAQALGSATVIHSVYNVLNMIVEKAFLISGAPLTVPDGKGVAADVRRMVEAHLKALAMEDGPAIARTSEALVHHGVVGGVRLASNRRLPMGSYNGREVYVELDAVDVNFEAAVRFLPLSEDDPSLGVCLRVDHGIAQTQSYFMPDRGEAKGFGFAAQTLEPEREREIIEDLRREAMRTRLKRQLSGRSPKEGAQWLLPEAIALHVGKQWSAKDLLKGRGLLEEPYQAEKFLSRWQVSVRLEAAYDRRQDRLVWAYQAGDLQRLLYVLGLSNEPPGGGGAPGKGGSGSSGGGKVIPFRRPGSRADADLSRALALLAESLAGREPDAAMVDAILGEWKPLLDDMDGPLGVVRGAAGRAEAIETLWKDRPDQAPKRRPSFSRALEGVAEIALSGAAEADLRDVSMLVAVADAATKPEALMKAVSKGKEAGIPVVLATADDKALSPEVRAIFDGHPGARVIRNTSLWMPGAATRTLSAAVLERALEGRNLLEGVSSAVALNLPPGAGVDWTGVKNPYLRDALVLILDALRARVLSKEDWEAVTRVARMISKQA